MRFLQRRLPFRAAADERRLTCATRLGTHPHGGEVKLKLKWISLILALSAVITLAIVYDGESTWIEGVALIGLYVLIAAAFWW